jgi:polyhydroxybutyrate depolymerase
MHLFKMPRKHGLTTLLVLFWFLSVASLAQADSCNFSLRGTDQICTLTWNNLSRHYLLHVPSSFVRGQSAILLGLHGSQGSGPTFEGSSLTAKADQVGFAAVYPSATNPPNNTGIWQFDGVGSDDGSSWLWTERGGTPPDDIGFIRQLIATLQAELSPDPDRIYVVGFSVGGSMAQRVAIDLSDVVAAIGVVEGGLPSYNGSGLPLAKAPVSVIVLHGTLDSLLFCGIAGSAPHSSLASQDQVFSYWTGPQANQCGSATSNTFCTNPAGSLANVTERYGTICNGRTAVTLYELIGGQHAWYDVPMNDPTKTPYNPSFANPLPGIVTDDILWNFFAAHPKNGIPPRNDFHHFKKPLARGFSSPFIANITSRASIKAGVSGLLAQGAEAPANNEIFGFTANGNTFITNTAVGRGNDYGLNSNRVRGFAPEL